MTSAYEQLLRSEEGRAALAEEHAIAHVAELVATLLKQSGMTRTQLAERMKVSRGRITQLLDGDANMTLGTVARILLAFDHVLECSSRPIGQLHVETVWRFHQGPSDWKPQQVAESLARVPVSPVLNHEPLAA